MKCPHCHNEIKTAEQEPYPDVFYIVVDRRKRKNPLTDQYHFKALDSTYVSKDAAQAMGVVAGRAVYECKRAGATTGYGGRKP